MYGRVARGLHAAILKVHQWQRSEHVHTSKVVLRNAERRRRVGFTA